MYLDAEFLFSRLRLHLTHWQRLSYHSVPEGIHSLGFSIRLLYFCRTYNIFLHLAPFGLAVCEGLSTGLCADEGPGVWCPGYVALSQVWRTQSRESQSCPVDRTLLTVSMHCIASISAIICQGYR